MLRTLCRNARVAARITPANARLARASAAAAHARLRHAHATHGEHWVHEPAPYTYEEAFRRSIQDPVGFWGEAAEKVSEHLENECMHAWRWTWWVRFSQDP